MRCLSATEKYDFPVSRSLRVANQMWRNSHALHDFKHFNILIIHASSKRGEIAMTIIAYIISLSGKVTNRFGKRKF